ncbi:PhzF family phenazine biosynthesis isomerase [Pseudodesulfovibrio sp. JC047]|uniref:PhzF family phenazine biosynthesis protein n=1 Tax=Pseudodesulfovibrio sp. JC047 TaxID=2683199 RepID=UPI0013D04B75|nr:PhzF family phenazine biosynthesis protein [Pseudodesulfovibrio sp. JC047]NDV19309.1 PhzF family phenazine biosynthesis isomerase [Pseudodesulfovibrio sp. JC047]
MELDLYHVDAFADTIFSGNPAAVIPLPEWLPDELMQNIARENNLSETAFFVRNGAYFDLRWFTTEGEVDLCGHATMASAHVLYEHLEYTDSVVIFETQSGRLLVERENTFYSMDFPAWPVQEIQVTERVAAALGARPERLYMGHRDMMAVFETEMQVRNLAPNFHLLAKVDGLCIVCTAPGINHDFVSRFFTPDVGLPEDPVTGSAHCMLVPYWADRLGRSVLTAYQASARGGVLSCEALSDRVKLSGQAVTFMKGVIAL